MVTFTFIRYIALAGTNKSLSRGASLRELSNFLSAIKKLVYNGLVNYSTCIYLIKRRPQLSAA